MISDKSLIDSLAKHTNSGYWSINGQYYFLNKAECLKFASKLLIKDIKITYHYFDSFYSSLKFDKEPTDNLSTLYKNRALQLRSKYKYICLAYTGGADSNNVLFSFLNNNIHLDEIITTYPIQAIDKLVKNFNIEDRGPHNIIFEYSHAAKPVLDIVATKFPKTKITVLDHSQPAIDLIISDKLHILPVGGLGLSPSLAGHYMIAGRMKDLNDKHDAVLITGVDKPRFGYSLKLNKFATYFDDVTGVWGNHSIDAHDKFIPRTEHFYYTLDMPEIWIKQCLLFQTTLKPIVDRYDATKLDWYKKFTRIDGDGNHLYNVHDIFFKKLLYNDTWSEKIFQADKPSGYFFQEHSNWFFKTSLTSDKVKSYHHGQVINYLSDIDKKYIVYNQNNLPLKFVEMRSKVHWLS